MNTLAKRLYNVAPDPVTLTFADGTAVTLSVRSAEFFQETLQAEGDDDDGTTYRVITEGDDDETMLAARETTDGWHVVGEVTDVERA